MTGDDDAFFHALETSLHRRDVRSDPAAVDALLAEDFLEFGRSGGVWRKPETVAALRREQFDRPVAVSDFAARRLAPSVVLLTYRATADGVATLRSSIWRRTDGRWRMIFHQGTPSAPQPDEP